MKLLPVHTLNGVLVKYSFLGVHLYANWLDLHLGGLHRGKLRWLAHSFILFFPLNIDAFALNWIGLLNFCYLRLPYLNLLLFEVVLLIVLWK